MEHKILKRKGKILSLKAVSEENIKACCAVFLLL